MQDLLELEQKQPFLYHKSYTSNRAEGWPMKLTQKQLDRGNSLLNQHAIYLNGEEISLYIHYWGGETSLNSNKPHKHSFFEICYIVDGEGTYIENGEEYPLRKGKLFLSRPNIKHQIISINQLHIVFIAFEPLYPKASEKGASIYKHLSVVEPFILDLQNEVHPELLWTALLLQAQQTNTFMKDTIVNLSSSLLFSLTQLYIKGEDETDSTQSKGLSTTVIHRAKLYIRDNLSQPLRLKDVAENLHISSRHLSRLFTEELGVTFTQYVRNERINRATNLLTTTKLPIKEIAIQTGFETVHYFTTVFKDIIGVTPGEFSKRLISNE
ncbi:helix-turn-helix domain-containing protein [Neobacillus sp. OS1-2]|uniref:helix-turn-helix domain-containing protein n=1 Tax=Neobacillus sp. OS1-2 TaxID=3070680 RepID=UPI0027DF8CF9|nr:helix-turn-helix domain-containing protein [Neobacillus sp. OS1-2]WML41489.1 helix-turn-helix domain-containing protein [Neobacillus sp. OS1-2]